MNVRTHRLPHGRLDRRYHVALKAALGRIPYRWSLAAGKLPRGLKVSASGVIRGRPKRDRTFRFTVRVDSVRPRMTDTQRLVLSIGGGNHHHHHRAR